MEIIASKEMQRYFDTLMTGADKCYAVAEVARAKGFDPSLEVEIPQADDLASRVEKQLKELPLQNVARIIREIAEDHGREETSLLVAKKVAKEFKGSRDDALDTAVRTGLAVLTEGILVAPLDGISGVKIIKGKSSDHVSIYYAGPIRSAGGTGQAMSILIADVVRRELGIGAYKATEKEVERWKEEIPLYRQKQHLQYTPTPEEIEIILNNCPICIDGDGTEKVEISGYRDLPRVETNRVRGGPCLVIAEGLCQKGAKIQKHVRKLNIDGWEFVDKIVKKKEKGAVNSIEPSYKFIKDVVGGRPVYGHPMAKGSFRFRYGRSRTAGLASISIHPATMYILEETTAVGTQIKIERPGKAGITTPCDTLEGPLVLMKNGDLIRINDQELARELNPNIREIIDLGEILIPVGEFMENNHPLIPGVFDIGWYNAILRSKGIEYPFVEDKMDIDSAFKFARENDIPLHPDLNFMWNDIETEDVDLLQARMIEEGRLEGHNLVLNDRKDIRDILITLGAPYKVNGPSLEVESGAVLLKCLGLEEDGGVSKAATVAKGDRNTETNLEYIISLAGVQIGDKCGTRIGARMARPEKGDMRKMSPPVHSLFGIGDAGGVSRLFSKAAKQTNSQAQVDSRNKREGLVRVDVEVRRCNKCGDTGMLAKCGCGGHRASTKSHEEQEINVKAILKEAADNLGINVDKIPKVKGVKGMISRYKSVEIPEKGILRAINGVFVFKDGTCRYDATDAPLTHFRPREINASVEVLRDLGYTKDIYEKYLERDDQMLELKIQDVIMPLDGGDYMVKVSKFIDDMLVKIYGMEPFYNASKRSDLIGAATIGLSPHTSGGVLSRLIGFTKASVGYAHPYFHAAKRRNCFSPDTKIWVKSEKGWELLPISQLVNDGLESHNVKIDDFGTLYKEEKKFLVPSISINGEQSLKYITAISRHKAPDHMIEFKTRSGRSITVTPEHKMLKKVKGLEFHPAHDLKVGDLLPSPKKLEEDGGDIWLDPITEKNIIKNKDEFVYSVTVEDNHTLVANDLYTGQCDGDEDCFMLLMDGLLNFSWSFLPERRGGRMDAPLLLSTILNPNEIDKEAHNVDLMFEYPLEMYEAGLEYKDPSTIEEFLDTAGSRIGTVLQYEGFGFTNDTTDIAGGPTVSSYKTLETMADKTRIQLELARKIRAVDQTDVAERLISGHFMPDMIGNLKSFSTQTVRCTKCGKKYRRIPVIGHCYCGHKLILTVHAAGARKYLEMSKTIAEDFGVSTYTMQRILNMEKSMCSLFDNEKVKNCTLFDF